MNNAGPQAHLQPDGSCLVGWKSTAIVAVVAVGRGAQASLARLCILRTALASVITRCDSQD